MITFIMIFIGLCLILEIKPIKRFLRGKDPDKKLMDNIKQQEKKDNER